MDGKGKIIMWAILAKPACACEELDTVRLQVFSLSKPRHRSEFFKQVGWTLLEKVRDKYGPMELKLGS